MVIGYHIILSSYGFWLPNDPRGSSSTEVWAEHLRRFGPPTKTEERQSVAGREHDRAKRLEAKKNLLYPAVLFSGEQIALIGEALSSVVSELSLSVHACAILPDHLHLVTARHQAKAEYIGGYIKRAATRRLAEMDLHPLKKYRRTNGRAPSPWGEDGWFVFLNTPREMAGRIRYVEDNPIKEGRPKQVWYFVVPYERGS
ncbi:MAG: hypothetical protein IT426_14815 [Pirellulales bacterium]|nr:hypothetical protein [Pirellulales bacterium]